MNSKRCIETSGHRITFLFVVNRPECYAAGRRLQRYGISTAIKRVLGDTVDVLVISVQRIGADFVVRMYGAKQEPERLIEKGAFEEARIFIPCKNRSSSCIHPPHGLLHEGGVLEWTRRPQVHGAANGTFQR